MSPVARNGWRIAVSLAAIALLLWRYPIQWAEIAATLRGADPLLLALSLLMLVNQFVLSSLKWRLVLRSHAIEVPFSRLFRTYLIGTFLGSLLPTGYLGDLARMADIGKATGRRLESASAVVLERLSGLVALALIGAVASLHFARVNRDSTFGALALTFIGVAALVVLAFVPGFAERLRALAERLPWSAARRVVDGVTTSILHYRSRPRLLAQVLALSFFFQALAASIVYLHARTLHLPVPFGYCLAFVPVMAMLEALPISIAGIGPRDGTLVYFLGRIGIGASSAISLSILILAARYAVILVGGVLLLFRAPSPVPAREPSGP